MDCEVLFRHPEYARRRAIGLLGGDLLLVQVTGEFVFMTRAEFCRSKFWRRDQVRDNYLHLAVGQFLACVFLWMESYWTVAMVAIEVWQENK